MCLVAFALRAHPDYRLVLAANRDEFHGRPAEAMHWWRDHPEVLAGRDLEAGGTWLAVSRSGRVATVTNYREDLRRKHSGRSRGELVRNFATGDDSASDYCRGLNPLDYAGFSLLASDGERMAYMSNRGDDVRDLEPGIYGLSNAALDTPWDKVVRAKAALESLVEADRLQAEYLFELLSDREPSPADDYSGTGLPPALARAVSAPFITAGEYGTRCSSVLLVGTSGTVEIHERRFDGAGEPVGEEQFSFRIG